MSDDLFKLYRQIYRRFIDAGQIEAAELWREEVMDGREMFYRDRKYTNLSFFTEWSLITAVRELVKLGHPDIANRIREDVLHNKKYLQYDLFDAPENNKVKGSGT